MADVECIIPARHRALLSVTLPWMLRDRLAQLAVSTGVSMASIVEEALQRRFAQEEKPVHDSQGDHSALATCLSLRLKCLERFPPLRPPIPSGIYSVYFLHALETEFVKIGISANLRKRMEVLNTSCMFPLKLAWSFFVMDGYACEQYWHRQFRAFRMQGEWFCLPRLFIRELAQTRQL